MLALSANPIADAIFPSRERSLYSIAELRRLRSEPDRECKGDISTFEKSERLI